MFRIDDPTTAASLPTPTAVVQPGYFQEGNPGSGTLATIVHADWLNAVQEEVIAVLTAAGQAPSKTTLNQLLTSIQKLTRTKLTANTTFYVSPTGSNANSGLSAGSPLATLQAAWNLLVTMYDLAGFNVTLSLAAGTYTAGLIASGMPVGFTGANSITISGAGATTLIDVAAGAAYFEVESGTYLTLENMKIIAGGVAVPGTFQGVGIAAPGGAVGFGPGLTLGACGAIGLLAQDGGTIVSGGYAYVISGSQPSHAYASTSGLVDLSGSAATLTGSPVFVNGFALATGAGAQVNAGGFSHAGAVGSGTSLQYAVTLNGVINTGGGGAGVFPGSGTLQGSGGQFA